MLKFGSISIELISINFQSTKKLIDIKVDIDCVISNKYQTVKKCFKYFIRYMNNSDDIVTSLSIILHILKRSLKSLEKTIHLKKYYEIWK